MDETARFALPLLVPGQAQKEVFHNEALTLIDTLLHGCVEGALAAEPPVNPQRGASWIVADAAVGAWAGKAGAIATWTDGGWRFVAPRAGTLIWNRSAGLWLHHDGLGWRTGEVPAAGIFIGGQQVVGPRQPPVASPSGGMTIDQEARSAIAQITAVLMSHGLID